MANQFNTTTHHTQTTSDNTPNHSQAIDEAVQAIARNAQAPLDMARQCVMGALDYNTQTTSDNTPSNDEYLGQVSFTGDEWQSLINALDSYKDGLTDLTEVMPANDQTATTAHPVTGEPVSREAIDNELECFEVLYVRTDDHTQIQCHEINLLVGSGIDNDFGQIDIDEMEVYQIGFTMNEILVNAIKIASDTARNELNTLQATWTGAKDKATKKAMKHLTGELTHLASINNKLANAIYDIRLDLAQSQADTGNHIAVLLPHEAVTLWRDEWFIYFNAYQQDSKPAPELDSNTLAYIQRLESENQQLKDRLKRQRINHSDSITTSICHLEYIKANLQALESVTFDNNPNFEDSQEYLLFASLNYLIGSYTKDRQSEQDQLGQGGNHASL